MRDNNYILYIYIALGLLMTLHALHGPFICTLVFMVYVPKGHAYKGWERCELYMRLSTIDIKALLY